MSNLLRAALAYAEEDLPVFPCDPATKRPLLKQLKNEAGKDIPGTGGFKQATTDPEQIRTWWTKWPDAMIGMPTGAVSGVDALDIDVKHDGFASVAGWGELSPIIVRTASGGAHLWFKADGLRNTTGAIGPGVDTRGDGGYVIVPPSRNGVGAYSFEKGSIEDRGSLPTFPPDLRSRLTRREPPATTPSHSAAQPEADPALIAAALVAIPNPDLGYDGWKRIALATWAATGGSDAGFEAFDAFSQKSGKYNARATSLEWKGIARSPPDRIGAGTLFHLAREANSNWAKAYDDDLQAKIKAAAANAPSGEEFFAKRGVLPTGSKDASPVEEPATQPYAGLQLVRHGEVGTVEPRWAIRNRLPEVGAGLLTGQWGMFKTFVALDLSAHLILGWKWAGQPVYRPGGVLMLAAEGAAGLPMRLAALVEEIIEPHRDDVPANIDPKRLPFVWADACPPLLGQEDPIPTLVATADRAAEAFSGECGLPLSLILIDTMAVAARFQNENDNGEVSRAMGVLHDLSRRTGAVVLGVDHLGKNAAAGARGASAKEANADFVLAVQGERDDETAKVRNTCLVLRKLRDGPQEEEIAFEPRPVSMGIDQHGYPLTSVVIEWDVARETKRKKPGTKKVRPELKTALDRALTEKGETVDRPGGFGQVRAARRDDVREEFRAIYKPREGTKTTARDQRFREALNDAREAGLIMVEEIDRSEFLWWPEADEVPF